MPENTDDPDRQDRSGPPPDVPPVPIPDGDALVDDDAPEAADYSSLLRNFDDAADLDDQVASDLDPGVDVGNTPDLPDEVDQVPLDIGEVVDAPTEMRGQPEGDEFGPSDDPQGSDAVEPPPDPHQGEDGDGVVEDHVETADLGELDSSIDDDEVPMPVPSTEIGLLLEDDHPRPSIRPWLDVVIPACQPRAVVVCDRGRVISAGTDVSVFEESGASTRLVRDAGSKVTSLLGAPDGSVFYTTERGELFRVDSRGPERITAWAEVFDLERPAYALELGGMTPSSLSAMLLRVGNRRKELLESTDHGATFRRVDLGGQILAVSSGSPPACLVKSERSTRVLRSEPTGGFGATTAAVPSDVKDPSLAVSGEVMAVLMPGRSIQVSADGGKSFREVPGLARATAVAAGLVAGRPAVFVALWSPATETAKVAYVDAASGEAIGVAGVESENDENGEHSRIVSLAWNEHTETLWAAGAFGLRCFRRPLSA